MARGLFFKKLCHDLLAIFLFEKKKFYLKNDEGEKQTMGGGGGLIR